MLLVICIVCIVFATYLLLTAGYRKTPFYKQLRLPYLWIRCRADLWGEYQTFRSIDKSVENGEWLFHIYLPKNDRSTTEVDMVCFCAFGVLVVECKEYHGTVSGTLSEREWTLVTPKGASIPFYNPILQNRTHCERVTWCAPQSRPHSLVVFGNATELRLNESPTDATVCNRRQLADAMTAIKANTRQRIDPDTYQISCIRMSPFAFGVPRALKKRHKEDIARQQAAHHAEEIPLPTDADAPPF